MDQPTRQEYPVPVLRQAHPDDVIDVKKYFFYFLRNWYWFVLVLCLTMSASWLYLKYTMKVWKTSTTMLIEADQQTPSLGTNEIMQGFGLNPGMQNVENQIFILKSRSLIAQAVSELDLQLEYYYRGRINKNSLYQVSPIEVVIREPELFPSGIEFAVYFFNNGRFRIIAEENDRIALDVEATWGEEIRTENFSFYIEQTGYWPPKTPGQPVYFTYRKQQALVKSFRSRLVVEWASMEATILNLSLEGINPVIDRDFLLKLTEVYLSSNLEKKNLRADRTIEFISQQLANIADSLLLTEDRLQKFRSRNKVMNISEQGSHIMEQAVKIEDARAVLINEANYFRYLMDYLQKESLEEQLIAPATIGISDPMLIRLVEQLAELQAEYYRLGITENENPFKTNLLKQIRNTKSALIENLESIIRSNELATQENNERLRELNAQAASLPVTERELLGIERQFKLNDGLYTLLLEKQAEARIQKASNTTDNEVIDYAQWGDGPIKPKAMLVYLIGLLAGLGIPGLILLLVEVLDTKIRNEEDIKKITTLPIAGHIPHSKDKKQTVVLENPRDAVAEAFRSLRSHLKFIIKDIKSPVILVTSSIPGEGKTFTAINLASVYSLTRKKTVLIGGDLRRPKLSMDFKVPTKQGLSTWLIGQHKLEDIIFPTGHEHLWMIPSGPLPPNPAELLNSDKFPKLIQALKERFDYIIIDSAPIGAVSDTFMLAEIADASIVLVRQGTSVKHALETTLAELKNTGLNHTNILVNDLKNGRGFNGYAYRYGNYARYGYQSR